MSISTDFLTSILDTLTDHIAVIDLEGKILYVNQSWVFFGIENSFSASKNWIGTNYLEACSLAADRGDSLGGEAEEGILSVIDKTRDRFYYEYPCHSPQEQRWFQMRVTPFDLNSERYLVISHSIITERKLAEEQIVRLSRLDSLTGLANRRYFDEWFANEWNRCTREQAPISLAIIDIDHFKCLNDSHGHSAGDECLKAVSDVLRSFTKRPNDICARYGGDEFMLVYSNSNLDDSLVLILKLMDSIRKLEIPNPDAPSGPNVTVSVGLSNIYPEMESNRDDLIRSADHLLYTVKDTGRDSVEFETLNS
ncbi:MAG: diguanylate cyclase [gamma proteobacterium symbiont of Ctena orbiculata]|nr:MAG: diguanylate cyclase [gamma proteobacterium symbiont of Ctena orbiculata]PVV25701.1 MAG: diguanylate cyclase [gamma proteobacterium symbiont of Ctena orbiculata]